MSASDLAAAAQRCLYGSTQAHCGRPATVHVLIGKDGTPTMSCAEHVHWWDTHEHHDQHSIGATCGLPGTTWLYATQSMDGVAPSRCVVEGLDDLHLAEAVGGP